MMRAYGTSALPTVQVSGRRIRHRPRGCADDETGGGTAQPQHGGGDLLGPAEALDRHVPHHFLDHVLPNPPAFALAGTRVQGIPTISYVGLLHARDHRRVHDPGGHCAPRRSV
jgi:hypothetical protein